MIETVIIAGVVGSAAGVLIAKLYLAGQAQDKATDAYEEGWTHGYDAKRKKFYSLLNVQRDKRVKCFANSREEAEQVFLANEFPREALIAAAEHALPVLEHERRKKRIRFRLWLYFLHSLY